MTAPAFAFDAQIWEHDGPATWCFVDLPEPDADDIADLVGDNARGFGSVRVEVTIGATTWRTSIFPDTKRGTYVLPVKKAIRAAEGLMPGDTTPVALEVLLDE